MENTFIFATDQESGFVGTMKVYASSIRPAPEAWDAEA